MGTHGRRGFDRLVLGSTTDRVMRKAACPVLVVSDPSHRDLATDRDGQHRLSRILYCTDFSNNSERARGYAISLAAEYGAELTLLHVAQSAPDLARAEVIIAGRTQELDKLVSETERKNLNVRLIVRFRKTLRGDCSIRNGSASESHNNDGAWRRRGGPRGFRLDYLSSDPVGALPCARGPYVIDTEKGRGFHG